jgi:hypothetical protein
MSVARRAAANGGVVTSLLADVFGGILLLAGGPGGIWRVLWVFWAETAAGGIAAAVLLRRGMASLSDQDWLAYAGAALDAECRRRPSDDETPAQHAQRVQARREHLAALAALDRRTPDGAAAFAAARRTEGNMTGGIFGCAFLVFSVVHAGFLLFIGVVSAVFATASGAFLNSGWGSPTDLAPTFDLGSLGILLLAMAVVFAAGLARLRRRVAMPEGEAAVREAMIRIGILQIVIIFGTIPAIVLGSVPLAVVFLAVKTAVDAYPLLRQRQA